MNKELLINWEFKKALKEKGKTLEHLQKETGINRSILSWATTGRINLTEEERKRIANALGKHVSELFKCLNKS